LIIKEKAKQFAIAAHNGQTRKNEPDNPMIMHPIAVGMLLEEYGYDDMVISAGYLHDVVEETKYTIQDIEEHFGSDIANLVMGASEPDKSLSWKKRKQHTIDEIKILSLRNKLVVCADKINNLEDLMITFQKTGIRDFSCFNAGEEQQSWYYNSIYESIILGQDKGIPIFQRLKTVLDIVFNNKKDEFLDNVFSNDIDYYNKLISLNAQKLELKKLKELCALSKPFVIEFCGTPRTGKTTILNNLYDFFKKGGFSVNLVEELTTSKYYKEVLYPQFKNKSIYELNNCIIKETSKQLKQAIAQGSDIIMIDRSLNDRAIWNHRRFIKTGMNKKQYSEITDKYSALSRELIDILVIGYTDSKTALKRDYVNSLALEPRRFLSIENIEEYNTSMESSMKVFENSVSNIYRLDTTDITPRDSSVLIAENIMIIMREQYIKIFNEIINKVI